MAITRAQQAKQMLQDGGMLVQPGFGGTRQGYRGGKDLGKGATGMGSGKTGSDQRGDLTREQFMGMKGKTRTGPKGEGDGPIEKLKTKLQTNALTTQLLNIAQKKKNIFGQIKSTLAPKGPIVAQDFVDFYNDPNLDQIGLTKNELTRANELIGGLQQIEKTGSLSQDKFEDVFFGGKTNPVTEPDPVKGGISPIIPVDTTFARAPVEEEEDYYGGRNPFDINRVAYRLMADGGAVIDDEPRQAYGLGSIVKKATRAVKKVAKSPVGKLALAYGAYKLGGLKFGTDKLSLFERFSALSPAKQAMLGIGATSALAGFLTPKEEEEDEEEFRGEGLDIPLYRRNPQGFLAPRFMAEGGSTEKKEPVAKKVMPLIDMDGKEKDYRETGGFVDMGRMERADDVPARLSKNEFVFTADAVRNAGDGDIDKGAEVMYNMMKNLEAGGEVSEESQGLEGARKMFQTSQRLGEVI